MKNLLIISFLTPLMAVAQQPLGYLSAYDYYPHTHNFFNQVHQSYLTNPIFLTESRLPNFTATSAYYNHTMGSLRLGQTPEKDYHIGLKSYGIYRHHQALFFGNLLMERNYETQKAWNVSYTNPDEYGVMETPHYFGVSLPANWNNQKYHISGGVILPVIKEKWSVLLSTDYTLQERYRTQTDPRAKINYVQWVAQAQTALTFNNHKVSLGGKIGYTNTQNNTSFADMLNDSPDKYNRYLKWQLGYGYLQNRTFRNTKSRNLQYEANLGYHYKNRGTRYWGSLHYNRHQYDTYANNSRDTENEDNSILANYHTDTFTLQANWLKYIKSNRLLVHLTATNTDGKNYLNRLQGSNYHSSQNVITLNASLLSDFYRIKHEIGLKTRYYQHSQTDALAQTTTDVAFLQLSPYYSQELPLSQCSFIPTFSVGYRAALRSTLTNNNIDYHKPLLPTDYASHTTHLFYNEVVYPAQAYFNQNHYFFTLTTDFKFRLKHQKTLLAGVSTQYQTTFTAQHNSRYNFAVHFTLVN